MSKMIESALFALVRSSLTGAELDREKIKYAITEENARELYRLAKEHDLAHLVGCELDKLSLLSDDEISKKLRKQHYASVFRYREIGRASCRERVSLCV